MSQTPSPDHQNMFHRPTSNPAEPQFVPVEIEASLRVEVSANGTEAAYLGKHIGLALFSQPLETITYTFLVRFKSIEEMSAYWQHAQSPVTQKQVCQNLRHGPTSIHLKSFRWVGYSLPEGVVLTQEQADAIGAIVMA